MRMLFGFILVILAVGMAFYLYCTWIDTSIATQRQMLPLKVFDTVLAAYAIYLKIKIDKEANNAANN